MCYEMQTNTTNKMKNGVYPVKKDHRQYSFTRTFGNIETEDFHKDFNLDAGLTNPDQNKEGYPYGCTGYTQTDIATDEDGVIYQPSFTYDKTLFMEGYTGRMAGCDIKDSLKSTVIYGLLPALGLDERDSTANRAAYYQIEKFVGLDWFDSLRKTLLINKENKRSISMASSWYPEWTGTNVNSTGIVHAPTNWSWVSGHNYKISGWKTIDGIPYLIVKSWQGNTFGDNGWCYFSRELTNNLMEVYGTGAFINIKSDMHNPNDVKLIKVTILDWVQSYTRILLSRI